MVPQSSPFPVVKQAAEPLQSVPQSDFHSVAKLAAEPTISATNRRPSAVKPVAEHVEVAFPPSVTRSGCIVKPPARFQNCDLDYTLLKTLF